MIKSAKYRYGGIILMLLFAVAIIFIVGLNLSDRQLIGQKVIIDGKELTITTIDRYDAILSDRTRINVQYAKTLIKESK